MNRKKLYIIITLIIVVLAIGIGILVGTITKPTTPETTSTRAEVSSHIVVPDQNTNATSVSKDVAIPTVSIAAAPGVSAQLRTFTITANKNIFTPSTVIAYTGDTIHINFTAVDATYDISFPDYNMKQTSHKGQTTVLEFQAQAVGDFTYYCDLCGGLTSSARGHIIIAPLTKP